MRLEIFVDNKEIGILSKENKPYGEKFLLDFKATKTKLMLNSEILKSSHKIHDPVYNNRR